MQAQTMQAQNKHASTETRQNKAFATLDSERKDALHRTHLITQAQIFLESSKSGFPLRLRRAAKRHSAFFGFYSFTEADGQSRARLRPFIEERPNKWVWPYLFRNVVAQLNEVGVSYKT